MYFDYIHPCPTPFRSTHYLCFLLTQICIHPPSLLKSMKFNLCYPYVFGCIVFHWNMVNPPGAMSLKTTDSPFPNQLSIAHNSSARSETSGPLYAAILSALILPRLLHATICYHNCHEFVCAAVLCVWKVLSLCTHQPLWLLLSLCQLFHNDS